MNDTSLPYNLLVLFAALLAFGLACFAAGRSSQPGSRVFMLLMLAVAQWSFCYVFGALTPDPVARRFWVGSAYIGIAFTGPLWLLFALLNTEYRERLPRWVPLGLGLLGTASLILVLANGALMLQRAGGLTVAYTVHTVHGPLFWLHAAIAYSTILAGMALYARAFQRSRAPYRDQARLMFLAALLPLIVNATYLAAPGIWNATDPTPVTLALSGLVFSYTIGRHRLLALSPIARQVVIDSMGDGLIVVDTSGTVVEHNPAAVELAALGCSCVGRHIGVATTDQALGQALLDMLAADASAPHEREIASLAAQPRRLHLNLTPLIDSRRRPIGTLFVIRDITGRAQVEEALTRRVSDLTLLHTVASAVGSTLEINELLRAIVTTTREALGVTSATVALRDEPHNTMTIVAESTTWAGSSVIGQQIQLLGDHGAALLRRDGPLVSDDAQHDERLAFFRNLLARRGTRTLLVAPLRAKETLIGVLNLESATPRGFSPEDVVLVQMIAGYVAAALANARLFDAAQEASRLKSSILDTVSHEFRTPITSIVGFAELFQERVLGPVNDEQQEALDAIQRGARRLLKLVDDLLDLARIESGTLDLELHPVEVLLCVQEAVNLVAPQFRQKNLDLRIDIDDNLAPIYADPMWLRRILINLLTNAVRFTDKGQVTVRAYETGPAPDEDHANDLDGVPRRVALEVEDTGVGVATADQHWIFEAFRRAPNAPASIAGGSGLGLAISRRVIEQMQGQLTLRSQPNSGSTFMIVLPLAELAREHQ